MVVMSRPRLTLDTCLPTYLPTSLPIVWSLASCITLPSSYLVFVLSTLLLTAARRRWRRRRRRRRRRIGSCTVYILRCAYATSAPSSTAASRRNARGARCRWLQSWPLTQTHRRTDRRRHRRRRRAGHILLHTSNPPCSSTSSRTEPAGYSNFAGGGLLNFQQHTLQAQACARVCVCIPRRTSSQQCAVARRCCRRRHHTAALQELPPLALRLLTVILQFYYCYYKLCSEFWRFEMTSTPLHTS